MRIVMAVAALAATAGCMNDGERGARREADQRALTNAFPVGRPQSCLPLRQIRTTAARDERTIDFTLHNGRVLRNRLPYPCIGLRQENSILYRTNSGQLCSTDTITVVHNSRETGGTCGLGQFQEVQMPAPEG